jgi:glutathione S-transferase
MKLLFSPTSPYVRKCLAVAVELELADRIERVSASAHPINRDATIVESNPLGKVPTLITDDGVAVYDSRVICEYLNDLGRGDLFPTGAARWQALTQQALGDGILDAALLARYEGTLRSDAQRSPEWVAGQMDKIATSLAQLERDAGTLDARVDIGTLAIGCALWYLDLRFGDLRWRDRHPALARWQAGFAQRDSMRRDWSS